ncbi:MAG: M48 family metallopeptidase [Rhodocyclaceae bacterium]|nr:M48 family metallopeptidase [Rhodocyclaceae bacterium]
MPANTVSTAFLAALLATTALRAWLALRQIRHVASHRGQVPAEFAASIPLADHQKAADYSIAKTRLFLAELAVDVALMLAFTFGGLLQWLADTLSALGTHGYVHGLALFAAYGAIGFAVGLPFSLYRTFKLEARFGFNKTTPALFVGDLAKGMLLAVVIGGPVLLAVLWLMTAMGDYWWLYVWIFWLACNLLILLLYPTLIAPLFNKFTPLADDALRTRVESLLARCGFKASGLFVMDGSRRSAHGNAYFMGFGKARRIVFFDTLLEKLTADEIEAVLAHELGHFKCHHIWKRIAALAAASLALLWLLGALIAAPGFYRGLGVATPGTAMALILFSLVLPVFTFPLAPLTSLLSRRHEFEADAYAARHAAANDLVNALVKLYRDNAATLTPDPLHSLFHDSHPPASLRIARLRTS